MSKKRHPYMTKGTGFIVKPLPANWALYRTRTRCCAAVGFYKAGALVLTSYICLN